MTVTVAWQQASEYPAAADRLLIAGTMAKSAAATARDGCLRTTDLAVTAPGGSMTLDIAAGQAMVSGYLLTSDTQTTVTLDVGGATARTDLVVARIYDAESGDAQTEGAIEVVKGTSTTEPALPPRSIKLASVAVGASVSTLAGGNLTDKRIYTTSHGGLLYLPGALSGAVPAGLGDGQAVWDPQAQNIGVNKGGSWQAFAPYVVNSVSGLTLNGSTTNPSGYSATCQYTRVGKLVALTFNIQLGANVGSGVYNLTLPPGVHPDGNWTANTGTSGTFYALFSGGTVIGVCVLTGSGNGGIQFRTPSGTWNRTIVGPGSPVAMASGDTISGSVVYITDAT